MKLKSGDTVKVLMGKDKGKVGKVLKIYPSKSLVLVEGVNEYKRHTKARNKQKSEIKIINKPLQSSKVVLICSNCKKPTRVGFLIKNNEKARVCKRCRKTI